MHSFTGWTTFMRCDECGRADLEPKRGRGRPKSRFCSIACCRRWWGRQWKRWRPPSRPRHQRRPYVPLIHVCMCRHCGKEWHGRKRQYCDSSCRNAAEYRRSRKPCITCGNPVGRQSRRCVRCANRIQKGNAAAAKVARECRFCGHEFLGSRGQIYCSKRCAWSYFNQTDKGKSRERNRTQSIAMQATILQVARILTQEKG